MDEKQYIGRKMVLTEDDLKALSQLLRDQHPCRFDNVTHEDMDFIKDLLGVYKESRSEVIKWLVKGIVYGSLILIGLAAYLKYSAKN